MKACPELRSFHAFPNFNGSPMLANQILLSGKCYQHQVSFINQPADPKKRLGNLKFGHSRIQHSLVPHDSSLLS